MRSTDIQSQPRASAIPWVSGPFTLIRRLRVQSLTGYSRSTLYSRIADGLMPKPVSLGGRAVGWPEREIEFVNAARIAGKPDEAIRALVARLEAARGTADHGTGEDGL